MLFRTSNPISQRTQAALASLQAEVDQETNFAGKAASAIRIWKNKTNNRAFEEIKAVLISMCVGTEICNYCEQNEATDIEHILPKSFFPQDAFRWDNYLLACKACNSGYKLDQIAVFSPSGSCTRFVVARNTQPPTQEVLMINPRLEDPFDYWQLNLETGMFLETPDEGTCEFQKANYTLEVVLHLNDREALRTQRQMAARDRLRDLKLIVNIHEAPDFATLDQIVNENEPFINLDQNLPLDDLKRNLINNLRSALLNRPHPTVWAEIIRQEATLDRFQQLFNRFPEARNW
ncbi:MAG: HNH endonuclease domain-containing protein [Bacteroidia bacterium]